ncbi:DUF5671 domain-containing protein [Kordiimonas sp.]|uniref:DUF5671 domain-containing protein n=1 Tax=Kordiimonas sp. TaxID=1970157 RepID=UPI003A8F8790
MASNTTLQDFVGKALEAGKNRSEIKAVLKDAGWQVDDISKALAVYHDSDFPVPVPAKHYSLNARDTVFYLSLFGALYLACWGVIMLAFNILDLVIHDVAEPGNSNYIEGKIRYWTAWSIVFVPAYLVLAFKAEKRGKGSLAAPMSGARQWLTYLTLFFAGLTALGDVVAVLYHFLGGMATSRFLLKVMVVAFVSGSVLTYYFRSIRQAEAQEPTGEG